MVVVLFFLSITFLILRIIYVNLIKGKGLAHSVIKLFGDTHSITYLFPLKHVDSEEPRTRKLKATANFFLYLFFLSFLALILYGVFTELREFE